MNIANASKTNTTPRVKSNLLALLNLFLIVVRRTIVLLLPIFIAAFISPSPVNPHLHRLRSLIKERNLMHPGNAAPPHRIL